MRNLLRACLATAALATTSSAFADHGGEAGTGGPYVAPAVEEAPPQVGKFWKVSRRHRHEVWLVDQSNTDGQAYGGTIYIYQDEALRKNAATATPFVLELGADTSALCLQETGANPVRPHMLVFNNANTHAALSFVASGHVVIFDAVTRTPLRCFRTEVGAGGVRQAHAVWPAPDDSYILVANQNGKKFERIRTDYSTETFTQEPEATLDLQNCTTPSGAPCEAPELRPDNAPICPFVPDIGYPAYVSLRGGGMLVVDPLTTPMAVISEYDTDHIPRDGCGFVQASGWIYGNGGGGNVQNPDGWFIYRVPEGGPELYDAALKQANEPHPEEISRDNSFPRDAHGVAKSKDEKYVYFFDRAANVVEIFDAATGAYIETENLVSSFSQDPTPDLAGESPDGKYLYVSMRGPIPLSGDPHASTGSTPGLLVVEMLKSRPHLAIRGAAYIDNTDSTGVQRADGHGIRVRRIVEADGCDRPGPGHHRSKGRGATHRRRMHQ
jgi:DNA-binding beta-propeller fold protein YncE